MKKDIIHRGSQRRINTLPFEAQVLLGDIIEKAHANGVCVKLFNKKSYQGSSGCFNSKAKEIFVCTMDSAEHWFPVLIHEACHMDQWIEQTEEWKRFGRARDIWEWVNGSDKGWTPRKVTYAIHAAQDVERDCERRTLKKIAEYKLTSFIDTDRYSRNCNREMYFYECLKHTRRWPSMKLSLKTFWRPLREACPSIILDDHKKIPKIFRDLWINRVENQ